MMFWYSDHMGVWGWVLMSFGVLALWGLLIAGVVILIRYRDNGSGSADRPSASSTFERLLAGRFANGEIDEPEYTDRFAALHR